MSRQIQKLSARKVASVIAPGRHSDGAGLYLNVTESGARSWIFMFKVAGRRREMGLGSARYFPCETERDAQWAMTLTVYCAPIAQMTVADVATDDVLRVLKPLWLTKPETASRLRGRIERVLDFAKARGMRIGENPARWRGHLDTLLPKRQLLTRGHHKAMPFDDVPRFITKLRGINGIGPKALEFAILTAARSGEVLGTRWDEVDLEGKLWTVPAIRMKGARSHRVPLSDRGIEILKAMESLRTSDFVFPGISAAKPLSSMALEMVLRRSQVDATVHGFRSAFRDWAGRTHHCCPGSCRSRFGAPRR